MSQVMGRLAAAIGIRRRWLVAGWALVVLAAVPFAQRQADNLTAGGALVPGSPSQRVDSATDRFAHASDGQQGILLRAAPDAEPGALRAAVARVRRVAADVEDVEVGPPPSTARAVAGSALVPLARLAPAGRAPGAGAPAETALVPLARLAGARGAAAASSRIALVPVVLRGDQSRRVDAAIDLRHELGIGSGARDGVTAHLVGPDALWAAVNDLSKEELTEAELIGLPISLAILLMVFGALAAALLPLALAGVTLALTGALVYALSLVFEMSIFVQNVASMVGIAVAIDYSLFILARFRQEIAAGCDEDTARRNALRSSGTAVVFSGLTVIVSLGAVFIVDSTLLRSMALGTIIVVAFSILAAVTLLPAALALFGPRAYAPGRRIEALKARLRSLLGGRRRGRADFWSAWTARVTRRPVLSALAAAALMLALAAPALDIRLGQGALHQVPPGHEARVGFEQAARLVPPGRLGPIQELVVFRSGSVDAPANRGALERHVAELSARPDVASVDPPRRSRDPGEALVTIVPTAPAETPANRALYRDLRAQSQTDHGLASVAEVSVGGATALPIEFQDQLEGSMWKIAIAIVALAYVILVVMLRSLVLPLKATLMTMLSVAAAYGVLVAVYQWGWVDGLFGYESPGHVEAVALPLVLAIVFGLSMDYEVFLLARIREALRPGVDTRTAVAHGLRASAATISSAALIMVSVFASFAAVGLPMIKQVGTGLAVATALDSTVVRLVLVPATMELLGRWNWWLPRPLERVLPRAAFEGEAPAPVAAREARGAAVA